MKESLMRIERILTHLSSKAISTFKNKLKKRALGLRYTLHDEQAKLTMKTLSVAEIAPIGSREQVPKRIIESAAPVCLRSPNLQQ